MIVPTAFAAGYARARAVNPVLADSYIAHLTQGDPEADALIKELNQHPREKAHQWIERGIEGGPSALADAPERVRDFFADLERVPEWFSFERAKPGSEAFYRNSEMFLLAVATAIMVEGLSRIIGKSLAITGKVVDSGVRRLKQNNRQILEVNMLHGLERQGDGWKLSVRARLVHARIRHLLEGSGEWDRAAWGTPLSAAHIGYTNATFSALLLDRVRALGVDLTDEECESYMMIWRYAGTLLGVAPAFSHPTMAAALEFHRIAVLCEPPPGIESVMLAHSMINAAPLIAGHTETAERRRLSAQLFRLSRALIGDPLADQLNYPPRSLLPILPRIVLTNKIHRFLETRIPAVARRRRVSQFRSMLDISLYSEEGLRYRMPHHVHAEKEAPH